MSPKWPGNPNFMLSPHKTGLVSSSGHHLISFCPAAFHTAKILTCHKTQKEAKKIMIMYHFASSSFHLMVWHEFYSGFLVRKDSMYDNRMLDSEPVVSLGERAKLSALPQFWKLFLAKRGHLLTCRRYQIQPLAHLVSKEIRYQVIWKTSLCLRL